MLVRASAYIPLVLAVVSLSRAVALSCCRSLVLSLSRASRSRASGGIALCGGIALSLSRASRSQLAVVSLSLASRPA